MYQIEFFEHADGTSPLWEFMEDLREKAAKNKRARIEFNQISFFIDLLARNGTRMASGYTKHLKNGIWELRPGRRRIFYFYYKDNTFVLLHHFLKKSQKTPVKELEKAIHNRQVYLQRKERST